MQRASKPTHRNGGYVEHCSDGRPQITENGMTRAGRSQSSNSAGRGVDRMGKRMLSGTDPSYSSAADEELEAREKQGTAKVA